MQNGDVAKTYEPFRRFGKACKINFINDLRQSVSTAAAKNGFYIRVIKRLL
jgi:hypothetical protein